MGWEDWFGINVDETATRTNIVHKAERLAVE
jgi:hypothetical protein